MKSWDEYYLVFEKSEPSSSGREVLLNRGESLSLYQFNADMTWMHAEITRTDKPYRNELNQNCQQTLVFYTEVGQHGW